MAGLKPFRQIPENLRDWTRWMKAQDIPEESTVTTTTTASDISHATATLNANAASFAFSTARSWFIDLEPSSGNVTLTLTGGPASDKYAEMYVRVQQDGGSARTITWAGGTFQWAGGTAPVLTATLDAVDVFKFRTSDSGGTWIGSAIQNVS